MCEKDFKRLLLKTAFSVIACDGKIDEREIEVIKLMAREKDYFRGLEIQEELNKMLFELKEKGYKFFQEYFSQLEDCDLSEHDKFDIISISIDTINADEKVEYSEIKFFKIIRSTLRLPKEKILKQFPEIEEFLEDDIYTESYITRLKSSYFGSIDLSSLKKLELKPYFKNS